MAAASKSRPRVAAVGGSSGGDWNGPVRLDAERPDPASSSRRLAARLIDAGILAATAASVFAVGLLLEALVLKLEGPSRGVLGGVSWVVLGLFLVYVFVPSLLTAVYVYEVFLARKKGQTLGKRQMGICVLHQHGSTIASVPTGRRLAARTAVMYVPNAAVLAVSLIGTANQHSYRSTILFAIPAYVLIVAVPALFDSQRRGLHDLIAGTVVVSAPGGWERARRRGPGDEGFDSWQGFMRGCGSESHPARHVSRERRAR